MQRRTWAGVLAFAVGVVALLGCSGDDDDGVAASTTTTTSGVASVSSTVTTTGSTTTAPVATTEVRAYFVRDGVVQPVRRQATPPGVAGGALAALVAGPTAQEESLGFATSLPSALDVHGVDVAQGVATVDLTAPFADGGDLVDLRARVAQVVFTLTQFPTVEAVAFRVDGRPLADLAGQVPLSAPQRRADWENLSPVILVEAPLPGTAVGNPVVLRGTANTFEATFHVILRDGAGQVLADQTGTATSGSGTRGTFQLEVPWPATGAGPATLSVFEDSAEDGRPIHQVDIPVTLAP